MAKKFLASLFIFVSLLFFSANISYADDVVPGSTPLVDTPGGGFDDGPWKPSTDSTEFENYRAAIEDDGCMTPSLECLVHQVFRFSSMEFVNSTLYSEITPQIGDKAKKTNYDPNNPSTVATTNNNILYSTGRLVGQFYKYPVAGTQTYIADVMNSAHISQAYAQGLGFASLNPILDLWKAFRNLAYMFFVIIFMVIGFMIMFRQKIGGQAAVTAQQAIPGVIISLILVTFSYAIAGLLIDFMYLVMFLIIGVFGETLPDGSQNLIDMNIRQVSGVLFTGAVGDLDGNSDLVSNLLGSLVASENLLTNEVGGVIGGLTLTVVLAIAILIGTVKLFFELLKSYASIILTVVTAPLVLMKGAIPGQNPVIPWIKNIIGNLLPFPVVLLVLVLFFQFKENAVGSEPGGFMPPFLLAQGGASAIADLMGLALILALPEIVKDSKKGLVTEGFGGMVFKAATESAKQGWKGSEIIPGVAASAPGKYGVSGSLVPSIALGAPFGAAGGAISNKFRRSKLGGNQPIKENAWNAAGTGLFKGVLKTGGAMGNKVVNPEAPKKAGKFIKKIRKGF